MKTIDENQMKKILEENEVLFGTKQAKKSIKNQKAEKIIVSKERKDIINFENKEIFEGDTKKLGYLSGKPFNISVVTVLKGK